MPNTKSSHTQTILVIEDEKPLARALELKLQHEGFATHVSFTGKEGIGEVLKGGYDLVLLDLIMPELDGFTVLQTMQEKKCTVPVIVLSNLGQEEDKAKAKTLGAVDYFVKANTPIVDIIKRIKQLV